MLLITHVLIFLLGLYLGWRSVGLYRSRDWMTVRCLECGGYGMIGKIHNDYDECAGCVGYGYRERTGVLAWLARTFLKWSCH